MKEKNFKCPFEIKGEKEGTILEIQLTDNMETRFLLIRKAFETFHSNTSLIAIKFCPPLNAFEKCPTLRELNLSLLHYQTEILSGELDYRLDPFLPYQGIKFTSTELEEVVTRYNAEGKSSVLYISSLLVKCFINFKFIPQDIAQLSEWFLQMFLYHMNRGIENPHFDLLDYDKDKQQVLVARISRGSATFFTDRRPGMITDATKNKNCFSVVKTPFYPKEFGRYSEKVEIWLTREADFASVAPEARKKIRFQSNAILQGHGIIINDLYNDKQPDGLWITSFEKQVHV